MTKDEALALALEALGMAAELQADRLIDFKKYGLKRDKDIGVKYDEAITAIKQALAAQQPDVDAMIALARADEREACALVCDAFQARDVGMQPAECAGAIRARGNT